MILAVLLALTFSLPVAFRAADFSHGIQGEEEVGEAALTADGEFTNEQFTTALLEIS